MDSVKHQMDLVGMKFVHGMPFFHELPTGFIKSKDFKVFFRLKKHKRVVHKDNLEKKIGMNFIVYSPATFRYWYRDIWEMTNMRKVYKYFKDGNVYVHKSEASPEDTDTLEY